MEKKDLLNKPVRHIDIKSFDSSKIIEAMKDMSFTARDTAKAAEILKTMINDPAECLFLRSRYPSICFDTEQNRVSEAFLSAPKRLNLENLLQFPAKGFSIRLKRAPPETRQRGNMIEIYFKRGEILANGRAERK